MQELPQIDVPLERVDAQRNRERILCAAARLIEDGPGCAPSVDRIAAEAGVGKGTVFRRFGDRAGLFRALLSERGAAFQEELIRGEPPLGPGAPAVERLLAFGPAYLAFVEENADLMLGAEAGSRGENAAHVFLHIHQRRERGISLERLAEGWCGIAGAAVAAGCST